MEARKEMTVGVEGQWRREGERRVRRSEEKDPPPYFFFAEFLSPSLVGEFGSSFP